MKLELDGYELILEQGDITRQAVDAIVTAANSGLLGGGGVDGAVHRAAGPELLKAITAIGYCPTGSAVITPAFGLGAKYVIHAVGPIWHGGSQSEAGLLVGAYSTSLMLANRHACASVAFPSISTGAYGFPVDKAASLALSTIIEFFQTKPNHLRKAIMVLYDPRTYAAYAKALDELKETLE